MNQSKPLEDKHDGCGLIAQERKRQEQKLGWTPAHDDEHVNDELRDAAIAYAMVCDTSYSDQQPDCWPWEAQSWKPSENTVENLVKSGALIAAEIDRHRRMFQRECNAITERDLGFTAFDEMDAYELEGLPWVGVSPDAFIREHFAEDYDRLLAEQAERKESDEYGEEEDDDGQG